MATILEQQIKPQTLSTKYKLKGTERSIELPVEIHTYGSDSEYQSLHVWMPCKDHYSFQDTELLLEHGPSRSKEHIEKCKACAVILGASKATVMNQGEVARLFSSGIYDKKTPKVNKWNDFSNLYSEPVGTKGGGCLTHYSTIEAIRLEDGTIINNNQCWSEGFASCPNVPCAEIGLPLSTIANQIASVNELVATLKFIDRSDEGRLFRIGDRHFINGTDEGQQFLAELTGPANTVAEAFELMKPEMVREAEARGVKVLRQGDIFFVPRPDITNKQAGAIVKQRTVIEPVLIDVNDECGPTIRNEDLPAMDSDFFPGYVSENHDFDLQAFERQPRKIPLIHMVQEIKKYTELDERQKLFKTRHYGTSVAMMGELVLVRGTVRHEGREHRMLSLGNDTWYAASQAIQKQSFKPTARGRSNRD